jgi:3-oxoacyl-[acyl-carrier protein] reductase
MPLHQKNALITGASRGIGKAIAEKFSAQGARIAVHYNKDRKSAEKTIAGLAGDSHILVQADMSDAEAVNLLVDEVIKNMGKIDILVNNAGIYSTYALEKLSYEEWQEKWKETLNTNLVGAANVSFLAARQMMTHGGGRIINISSRGAFRGEPLSLAYGASKAGMNSMSQSMAKALGPHKIFVYVIAPGFVATDMTTEFLEGPDGDAIRDQSPLQRVARPEEIADTALFLASGETEYLTGCIIDVNGASYLRT